MEGITVAYIYSATEELARSISTLLPIATSFLQYSNRAQKGFFRKTNAISGLHQTGLKHDTRVRTHVS